MKTFWAVVRKGKIETLEEVDAAEGTKALVTLLTEEDAQFWLRASQTSLDALWNNSEDDIYGQLLKE